MDVRDRPEECVHELKPEEIEKMKRREERRLKKEAKDGQDTSNSE